MVDTLFLRRKKILINRTIYIEIKSRIFKNTEILIKYFEGERLAEACKKGCPNYGKKWSCPPLASPFLNIVKNYSHAVMLVFSTATLILFNQDLDMDDVGRVLEGAIKKHIG